MGCADNQREASKKQSIPKYETEFFKTQLYEGSDAYMKIFKYEDDRVFCYSFYCQDGMNTQCFEKNKPVA
ncbi:MAG: hypothetical protein WC783_01090, partial [Candidatus Paceibacterota bacterium]